MARRRRKDVGNEAGEQHPDEKRHLDHEKIRTREAIENLQMIFGKEAGEQHPYQKRHLCVCFTAYEDVYAR